MSLWDWLQGGDRLGPNEYQRVVYIKPVLSVRVKVYRTEYGQVIGLLDFLIPSYSTVWPEQPVCNRALQFFQCLGKSYPEVMERLEEPLLQGFPEVFSEIVRSGVEGKSALERVLNGGPV